MATREHVPMDSGSAGSGAPARLGLPESRNARLAIAAVALAVVAVVAWLIVDAVSGETAKKPVPAKQVALLSEQGLKALTGALGRPVYWAGPRDGVRYELTQTSDDRIFVRYLPEGVSAESADRYPTIGTYGTPDALAAVEKKAQAPDAVSLSIGGGGAAYYLKSSPTNIFFSFPDFPYQIEIYDPDAAKALGLYRSGNVGSIPGTEQRDSETTTTGG